MSEEKKERQSKYQTFLIFGAPGSGKGTQGRILGQVPRFYHGINLSYVGFNHHVVLYDIVLNLAN